MNTVSLKMEKRTSSWSKMRGVGVLVCVRNDSYAV